MMWSMSCAYITVWIFLCKLLNFSPLITLHFWSCCPLFWAELIWLHKYSTLPLNCTCSQGDWKKIFSSLFNGNNLTACQENTVLAWSFWCCQVWICCKYYVCMCETSKWKFSVICRQLSKFTHLWMQSRNRTTKLLSTWPSREHAYNMFHYIIGT